MKQKKPTRYSLYQDHLIEDSAKLRNRLKLNRDLVASYDEIGEAPQHWEVKIAGHVKEGSAKKTLWRGDSRTNHGKLVDCREAKGGAQNDLLYGLIRKFRFDGVKGAHPPVLRAQFFKTAKHRRAHASITAVMTKAGNWRIKTIKHASIAEVKLVIDLLDDAELLSLEVKDPTEQPAWLNSETISCELPSESN